MCAAHDVMDPRTSRAHLGELDGPGAVRARLGAVYVADSGNGRIVRWSLRQSICDTDDPCKVHFVSGADGEADGTQLRSRTRPAAGTSTRQGNTCTHPVGSTPHRCTCEAPGFFMSYAGETNFEVCISCAGERNEVMVYDYSARVPRCRARSSYAGEVVWTAAGHVLPEQREHGNVSSSDFVAKTLRGFAFTERYPGTHKLYAAVGASLPAKNSVMAARAAKNCAGDGGGTCSLLQMRFSDFQSVTRIVGAQQSTDSLLFAPQAGGVDTFVDPADPTLRRLLVTDTRNHRVWLFRLDPQTGEARTPAIGSYGSPGGGEAEFDHPVDVRSSGGGKYFYVSDQRNHRVMRWQPSFDAEGRPSETHVRRVAGSGSAGGNNDELNHPAGIALSQGFLFVYDGGNRRVMRFPLLSAVHAPINGSASAAENPVQHEGSGAANGTANASANASSAPGAAVAVAPYVAPVAIGGLYDTVGVARGVPLFTGMARLGPSGFLDVRGSSVVIASSEGGLSGVLLRWVVGESGPTVLIPYGGRWDADVGGPVVETALVQPAGSGEDASHEDVHAPAGFFGDPGRDFEPAAVRVRGGDIFVSDSRDLRLLKFSGRTAFTADLTICDTEDPCRLTNPDGTRNYGNSCEITPTGRHECRCRAED